MASDVEISIGAQDSGLRAQLKESVAAVQSAAGEMRAQFAQFNDVFKTLQSTFLAFTAVLAGGKAFKDAIESTVNITKESVALGKQFGITATQASTLKVAMGDVFVSQDTVAAAGNKISQALKKNESAFTDLGVATRDQNGNFRNQLDIMQDVNTRLLAFKEGTDRNVEGTKIYGRAWGEVAATLKLTPAVMAAAQEKAEALGLVVGQENVEATGRYRSAMNEVHDVILGVEKAVGDALLPVLSSMGEWFASIGPTAVQVMKVAMLGLTTVFEGIKVTIQIAYESVKASVQQMVVLFLTLADVGSKALKFDFSGAKAAWGAGIQQMRDIGNTAWDNIRKDSQAAVDAVAAQMQTAFGKPTAVAKKEGGETSDGGDDREKSQLQALQLAFEQRKLAYEKDAAAHGQFLEFSKQMEVDYWKDILATADLSTSDRLSLQTRTTKLEIEIGREAFAAQLADLKAQEAEYRNNMEAKLAIQQQYVERVRVHYGEDSKQYMDARKAIVETERQIQAQLEQIRGIAAKAHEGMALADVDADEAAARLRVGLGIETNAQLLQQEQDFEARRFEIKRQALVEALQLEAQNPDSNLTRIAEINAQIEQLETQHQARLSQIKGQAALEANKYTAGAFTSMQSGFATAIGSMLQGTQTFAGGMRSMWTAITSAITQAFANMVAQNIVQLLRQAIVSKEINLKEIGGSAAKAGAAAFSAVAGIPIIGPVLAPVAAAAAFAGTLAFGNMMSAEGGYSVPAGVNPVTQLHQKEMVLPASIAEPLRAALESGALGGGGGHTVNLHIHTPDAKSTAKLLMDNRGAVAEALRRHMGAPSWSPA